MSKFTYCLYCLMGVFCLSAPCFSAQQLTKSEAIDQLQPSVGQLTELTARRNIHRPPLHLREQHNMKKKKAVNSVERPGKRGSDGRAGPPGPPGPQGKPGPGFNLEKNSACLTFSFNPNTQSEAQGNFVGIVTLPDQSQLCVDGEIGLIGVPHAIVVGPDAFVGSYTVGFFITSLTGQLDQPPMLLVTNSLTGDHVEFVLAPGSYEGGCDIKHFINRQK